MTELIAWIAFPLLALLVTLGTGLLAERLAGVALEPALLPPLGFCAGIALVGPGYALGAGAGVALAVLAAATASGLWLARRELTPRFRPGLGALAGVAVYGLYMAPVVLSGDATFLGYNLLNDTAIHLALVDYVSEFGRQEVSLPPSSFASAINGYIGKSYPLGSHELLAALRAVLDAEPARVYQPFLATSVGLAAAALFALLRRAGAPAAAAAVGAALALSGQLLFSFSLQGGIKELTFVAALATAAAIGARLLDDDERPAGLAALRALAALAAYAINGLAALAWLGPLALLIVGWALALRTSLRARLVPAAVSAALVLGVLGLPTIAASVEFYREGKATLTSESELGPLVGPIKSVQAAGIWLRGDYRRLPESQGRRTYLLIGVALALAALGAGLVLRLRSPGPLLFLLPSLVAWLAVSRSGSPYVDAKLLAVLSPAVVLFSCVGVGALWRARKRLEAAGAAIVLVGAIGLSDALAYRLALPAPMDRLEELADINRRFEGQGPLLVNEFEEYVKHFARDVRAVAPYEGWTPPGTGAQLRDPGRPVLAYAYTLDELTFPYVKGFPLIALRRSPAESRPPEGYEHAWRGRFYEVWRRASATAALDHVRYGSPTLDPLSASSLPACRELTALGAAHALLAAVRPPATTFDVASHAPLPPGWARDPRNALTLAARAGGAVSAEGRTGPGRHRVWLKGRTHHDDELLIDGRVVGIARHLNTPNQWIDVGAVDLAAGRHRVELRRPARSLAPGDGQADIVGPVVLAPEGEPRLVRAPAGGARRLCGRSLDWVEQLPPRGG